MKAALFTGFVTFLFYLAFQATGIYAGDSGDLVTAAAQFGIPHPPGYPLYSLLGWVASHIPLATIAWRVGLVSSLSHAATIGLVYALTWRITRHHMAAIFASLILAGNYIFFLYSVTAEVFGLLDVFVISFFFIAERITQGSSAKKWVVLLAFTAGLSLAHHHMILCMGPSLVYLWLTSSPARSLRTGARLKLFGVFLLGLLPYLYIPIAAYQHAAVNWDRPVTIARFFHLITRADYGTFQSGSSIESGIYQRVLSIKAFMVFVLTDFTWAGVVLLGLGSWWLVKHRLRLFVFWVLAVVSFGPLFAFYANFPLGGRFALGTFERFMLPSYVLMAPVFGFGALQLALFITYLLRGTLVAFTPKVFRTAIVCVLLLLPVTTTAMTVWRFWGIRTDATAAELGLDILSSAPPNAIVLLVHDTSLFVTQYVRYGLSIRPDTTVVHVARIPASDYREVLQLQAPSVIISSSTSANIREFIISNRAHRPIVSNSLLPLDAGWAWIPHGMLYLLVDTAISSPVPTLVETNTHLWTSFHNPRRGILSRYNHLMLANVLDEYANFSIAFADALLKSNRQKEAKVWYVRAVEYGSDGKSYIALTRLGMTLSLLKDCAGALDSFKQARNFINVPDGELYSYEGITWRDCVGDARRAQQLFEKYDAAKKKSETPLEQL